MKKRILSMVLVAAMSMSIFAACGNSDAGSGSNNTADTTEKSNAAEEDAGEAITLRAVTGFNDGHHYFIGSADPVMNKVEEDTNVSFEKFYSGELVGHAEEYDALTGGIADFAMSFCASYDSARFVLSDVFTLPCFDAELVDVDTAWVALLDSEEATIDGQTFYEYEYGSKGLIVFPNHMTDTYHIISCKADIKSMDAYNSSTIMRTPTRMTSILAEDLGFSTVTMTISDAYDAMSRGAVNGMLMCADWKQYGLDQLYKYIITGVNLGNAPTMMMMLEDKYEELPDAAKDILVNYSRECTVTSGVEAVEANNDLNWESAEGFGVEVIEYADLPAEVQQHITDASVQVWFDWIDDTAANGYPAKEAAILWRDCLAAQGVTIPEELQNLESYEPGK